MYAYEREAENICLVLIKTIASVRRSEMRQRIERLVFDLLDTSAMGNIEEKLIILARLERFLRFGIMIYEIEPMNGRHVIEDIEKLRQRISLADQFGNEFGNQGNPLPLSQKSVKTEQDAPSKKSSPLKDTGQKEEKKSEGKNADHRNEEEEADNSAMRQSAIMDIIRQSGNKRISSKELIAAFPDISQRTLRYDLQKLCRQGIIVRIGEGGPNTAYEMRSL